MHNPAFTKWKPIFRSYHQEKRGNKETAPFVPQAPCVLGATAETYASHFFPMTFFAMATPLSSFLRNTIIQIANTGGQKLSISIVQDSAVSHAELPCNEPKTGAEGRRRVRPRPTTRNQSQTESTIATGLSRWESAPSQEKDFDSARADRGLNMPLRRPIRRRSTENIEKNEASSSRSRPQKPSRQESLKPRLQRKYSNDIIHCRNAVRAEALPKTARNSAAWCF